MIPDFLTALERLDPVPVERILYRCVVRDSLESSDPPAFLFTSGRPNRYNPAGVECVYWGETMSEAVYEFQRYFSSAGLPTVPFTVYSAEASLAVLDLGDSAVLKSLGLKKEDLHAPWRRAASPTLTQLLGHSISLQRRFCAIRFPSDAALAQGHPGWNVVAFRASMRSPYFLRVFTGDTLISQSWP